MEFVRRAVLLVALLAPLGAEARQTETARAFTERLYQAYRHGEPDVLGARAATIFAPRLLALIRRDQASTPAGEVGVLDWDPVCDCQDDEGMKAERVAIRSLGPERATATVTLKFSGETSVVKLGLVSGRNGWRVADIHTRNVTSLVGLLENSAHPRTRATSRPHQRLGGGAGGVGHLGPGQHPR